jgi:glycosyltransferase involved in cell wall biosynthesis
VSVLIPCYNAEPFIGEAIESALSQSLPPDELIVIDDGSEDGSVRVARSFGERVRVVSSPHAGVGAARNAGLMAAHHELVAWLDADDVWEQGKLADQVPLFANPHVGLSYGQMRRFTPATIDMPFPADPPDGDIFEQLYLRRCFIPTSTVIVRRQAMIDAGGFDGSVAGAEDVDAWLRMAARWSVAAVARPLSRYRIHDNQISRNFGRMIRCGVQVREKLADEFERRTGLSSEQRRQLVAQIYLDDVTQTISRRELPRARAVALALQQAFASDAPRLRRAITRKQLVASLPRQVFWAWDVLRRRLP